MLGWTTFQIQWFPHHNESLRYPPLCHFSGPSTRADEINLLRQGLDWDNDQKLRVEEGEEVGDILRFYKGRGFNPLHPYVVQYRGQDAADAGGVSRQFFTNLFSSFKREDKFFEGTGMN